jgi:hypothetical protein
MKKIIILGVLFTTSLFSNAQFWKTSDPERLPSTVNSAAEEGTPIFSPDNSYLYFTRTFDVNNVGGEFDQDIWFSKRAEDGKYSQAESIKSINNKFNNAVVGINAAGNRLYVLNSYDGKKDTKKGIDVVERSANGSWGKPTKVNIPDLDIEGDFYGFHVTPDEKTIIISYKGPKTVGEEDLYVTELTNGSWTAPQHLGSTVNSAGFEMSPFLSPGKDTLYFSSNGMGGKGDADIFYSVKQGSWTQWSNPVNLGAPFNTEKFDAYFSYSGNFAYWASNRDSERSNIYKVEILTPPALAIACSGTDVTIYEGTNGTATANITDGVSPYSYKWSNGDTQQTARNLVAGVYTVEVTDDLGQKATCEVTIGQPELLELTAQVMFDYNKNKAEVSDFNQFLKSITEILNKGKGTITISIESSASKVTTRTFKNNEELAKSRANQTAALLSDYFKEKGLLNKVEINITQTVVKGPDYTGDFENEDKYKPYQYVKLLAK